jgi:L-aminopeptidase/D-esterase-like protein
VTGTATVADIIGPDGQGIAPGEFSKVIEAIRSGVTYVNVHSKKIPPGEIRGQIRVVNRNDDNRIDRLVLCS